MGGDVNSHGGGGDGERKCYYPGKSFSSDGVIGVVVVVPDLVGRMVWGIREWDVENHSFGDGMYEATQMLCDRFLGSDFPQFVGSWRFVVWVKVFQGLSCRRLGYDSVLVHVGIWVVGQDVIQGVYVCFQFW